MARKPKNPVNDIINTVGGWLGGRGPGTNPQVQAAMQATRAIARTADTATGGFGSALLSDAQRMAMTGSSTPSALYKTAAVNLGAAATGVGAAKVAGKVAGSPVGRRATRALTQRKDIYVVHGSPTKGIKNIDPKFETMPSRLNADPPFAERWPEGVDPSTAAFYGHNVTSKGGSSRLLPRSDVRDVITDTTGYARGGSIYIARTPAKMWEGESSMAAARVVREVPVARTSQTVPYEQAVNQTVREVERQLKKLGFKYPKVPKKR